MMPSRQGKEVEGLQYSEPKEEVEEIGDLGMAKRSLSAEWGWGRNVDVIPSTTGAEIECGRKAYFRSL